MRRLVAAASAVALGCASQAGRSPGSAADAAPPPEEAVAVRIVEDLAPDLRVEVGCSETELRTSVATVTWRATKDPDASHVVDVGVNKGGFTRGHSTRITLGPEPRLERVARTEAAEKTLGRALAFRLQGAKLDRARNVFQVRVAQLEPGVVYFWRVAQRQGATLAASKTVRVEVPPCVADIVEERR